MSAPLPTATDSLPGAAGSDSVVAQPRHHGLDWLRAVAALAVIALHAGIAYTVQPFPGLAWPVHDPQPSPLVDALTWWIDAWIMPVFFLMGGCLAAQLFARLGPAEFLRHRARRLLVPLAFACVVILPLDLYAWLLGWVVEGRIPLQKLRSLKLGETGRDLWGVAHLWFLEYLFVFCAGAVIVQWGWNRWSASSVRPRLLDQPSPDRRVRPLSAFGFPLLNVLAFACSVVALDSDPQLVIGFRHAWHPLPANLLYYAPCFAAGWWLLRRGNRDWGAAWISAAGIAVSPLLIAAALPLIHSYAAGGLAGAQRSLLVMLFAASGWTLALGALRLSLIPCPPPPRAVQYVSQASFWMYLFHHPAVGLAQVALHGSRMTAGQKFLLVWLSATALSLLTYAALIRRTWIGTLLNGRREPQTPTIPAAPATQEEPQPLRRAA